MPGPVLRNGPSPVIAEVMVKPLTASVFWTSMLPLDAVDSQRDGAVGAEGRRAGDAERAAEQDGVARRPELGIGVDRESSPGVET